MNNRKLLIAVTLLVGTMGIGGTSARAEDVISKEVSAAGSYCHMKFPAIDEKTLSSKYPILTDASSGDIIDFYGPCNHDPLGKDEVHAQLLQLQHRRARDYMD